MKRLRIERWSGQLLSPRTRPCCLRQQQQQQQQRHRLQAVSNIRLQSTSARDIDVDDLPEGEFTIDIPPPPSGPPIPTPLNRRTYPSPTVQDALHSAKLAALHARLSLPKKLPIETMARTLVDASADPNIHFNNATLAQIGGNLMSYHVSEWLLCHYPRLPMTVLFAAAYAYNGPKTLKLLAHEWGVEAAAAPGDEVDPGFLQFDPKKAQPDSLQTGGQVRPDRLEYYRRGVSSRVVYDDDFGDTVPKKGETLDTTQATETAYSNFVKAVVGSIYLHAGRNAAKTFIQQHILSRNLSMSSLFAFKSPVRDLSRLCAREDFEYPVARLLSETGRHSISPVFVVGIFSGKEKLGEGAGPSLEEARIRASVAALKAWYLYSPGNNVRVPSDMEDKDNKLPWDPVYIDIGEII